MTTSLVFGLSRTHDGACPWRHHGAWKPVQTTHRLRTIHHGTWLRWIFLSEVFNGVSSIV